MKKIIKVIFVLIVLVVFSDKVYANDYTTSLTTNHKGNLKSGDIIELNAGIGAVVEDWQIEKQDFLFVFDKDIFELVFEKDEYGFQEVSYKLREGWESGSSGLSPGRFSISIMSSSEEYNILSKDASDNSLDNINATLVAVKLKVKDADNQKTKVQLVNEHNYVEELEFNIYNKSTNNFLSSLKVEGYELSETFNKNKTSYDIFVPYETEKITVTAKKEDEKATLTGTGEKNIEVGDNKIELLVTAEDGSKKTYTINVIRKEANEDTSLSKIVVTNSNKEKVTLIYDEKNKTYTGDVTSDVLFVYFDIKCSGDGCYNEELEPTTLLEGKNEFTFNVISQNGDEELYKIILNKEYLKKDNTILYLMILIGLLLTTSIIFLILYLKNKKRS